MTTKEKEEELVSKILHGLEKSHEKLIASKRRNSEELVILQDNRIVKIKP